MSRLDEWVIKSPYTDDDLAYMAKCDADRRLSTRVYDTDEYTDWLIEKGKSFMKGTWLEQDLVPVVHNNHPWAFGIMSGPKADFECCTLHEIAHAIQLKKKDYRSRLKLGNRFQQPKSSSQTVLGRTYYEPMSMEVSLCEAEAAGINLVLLEMLGYEIDHKLYIEHWASVCQYLPDWYKGGKDREPILQKAIEMYYLVWDQQECVMEQRFKNFCKHVAKLRQEHADLLPEARRPVKAKVQ